MKRSNLIIKILVVVFALFICVPNSQAKRYSRSQAARTIEQTANIVNQAYEIANYYSYWQTDNLSRAMYYNDYACKLYYRRSYKSAIRYSLLAREYALDVIDDCDDYWEYFYYTYYGWSVSLGYNPRFAYSRGYMDGYYDGYYAHYCYLHQHDYRRDTHHSMNPVWYDNSRYSDVSSGRYFANNTNRGNTAIGRGDTGRNGNSSSSSSSTAYRGSRNNGSSTGRKNILMDNYFSDDEVSILKDMPNAQALESDFKVQNPEVTFDDKSLKSNSTIVTRSKENAQTFTSNQSKNNTIKRASLTKPELLDKSESKDTDNSNTSNTTIKRSTNSNTFDNNTTIECSIQPRQEPITQPKQQPNNVRTIQRPTIRTNNNSNNKSNSNTKINTNSNSNNRTNIQRSNTQTIKSRSSNNSTSNKTTTIKQPNTTKPQQTPAVRRNR